MACGGSGGGNPTAPTPAPSTTQAPPTVTTSGLFTFSFSAGMSLAEQDLIRNTILSGNTFFQTSMGRTIQQPTTIFASSTKPLCAAEPRALGFAAPGGITICVAGEAWPLVNGMTDSCLFAEIKCHKIEQRCQTD